MNLVYTIIIGLIVGIIARFLMPGKDPAGFILTTILGVAGAIVGALIGRGIGIYAEGEPAGFLMSILGAVLLLFAYKKIVKRGDSTTSSV